MKGKNSLLLVFIILTSCATKVVSIYNYDGEEKAPQSFIIQSANDYESLSVDNKKLDDRLQRIISNGLENKGLNSSSLPDLYVSYLINVFSSSETSNNNYNSPYRSYNTIPYSYNYSTRTYKEGVLIIDIKNGDKKLVWQGSKTFKLRSKQSVQETLPEICREIIAVYNNVPQK